MKNLIVFITLLLLSHVAFAQTTYECNGIKFTVLSVTESEIQVEVNTEDFPHQINSPSAPTYRTLDLENGTCTSCPNVGGVSHPKVRTWTIQNHNGPTKLTFTNSGGGCAGQTINLDGMECNGIKFTVLSVTDSEIQVEVNTENYPHQINSPSAPTYRTLDLENGTCTSCPNVGGVSHPKVRTWTIQNQAGATKLFFITGSCTGQTLTLD